MKTQTAHQHISVQDAVGCTTCNPRGISQKRYEHELEMGLDPSAELVQDVWCNPAENFKGFVAVGQTFVYCDQCEHEAIHNIYVVRDEETLECKECRERTAEK